MKRALLFAALLLAPALVTAQGVGQTSYRLVLTQDAADPSVRGAGFALVHGLWASGRWEVGTSAAAVKMAGEWSQQGTLDLLWIPADLSALFLKATPYVGAEINGTRVGGGWHAGRVLFVGVSINDVSKAYKNWRHADVTPSMIVETRRGWLYGGKYNELDLGYAP
jgi:hypothetical protein